MSNILAGLLIESSLRATLLAALVAVALAVLKVRASGVRHAAWTAVLAAMLLMPVLPYWLPAFVIPVPASAQRIAAVPLSLRVPQAVADAAPAAEEPLAPAIPVVTGSVREAPARSPAPRREWSRPLAALVIYSGGALFLLLRLVVGWRGARRLARESAPIIRGPELADVLESDRIACPVTVGAIAPTIVLPSGWRRWPDLQLRAVLAHERAHVARRDPLVAYLARLNACVFWFNPLAWWLERTLAVTAEHACDEAGLRAVGEPARYAEVLMEMAAVVRQSGGRLRWQGVGMNGSGVLARRIDRVLRGEVLRHTSEVGKAILVVSCCAAILIAAGCRVPDAQIEGAAPEYVAVMIDHYPDTEVAVSQADRPLAEQVLLRRKAEDPAGPWSARLGRFYAASLVGHWVRVSERGPLREMTNVDPAGPFAQSARRKLAETTDAVMLTAAAEFLRHAPRTRRTTVDESPLLAKSYLERALDLAPESVQARAELVDVLADVRYGAVWKVQREVALVSRYEVVSSMTEVERFELLPGLAISEFTSARLASRWADPNVDGYIHLAAENARKFALDLLALAPKFTNHPDYGTAVYKGNMTLASLAMRDGDTRAAVGYLREASAAPASDEITYVKGMASWQVVDDLVKAGERTAVVEFLERMAEKSSIDRTRLIDDADAVRRDLPLTPLGEGSGIWR